MRIANPHDVMRTLSALRAGLEQQTHEEVNRPSPRLPFITISRQAGAGGRSIAQALVARLNAVDPGDLPWTVWDGELVERVAAEHHVPVDKIEALEDQRPNWLETALSGLTLGGTTSSDHLHIYHSVAATIRSLAEVGRVVIVGRGAVRVTHDMPGATHVRLIAPLASRIAETATSQNISKQAATEWVAAVDRSRDAFYKRYWPDHPLGLEEFSAVYNTSSAAHEHIVESIIALVGIKAAPAVAYGKEGSRR